MKYSRTAIGLLTAQYRSVLKKCLLINLGLYALGAVAATPANAEPTTVALPLNIGTTDTVTITEQTFTNESTLGTNSWANIENAGTLTLNNVNVGTSEAGNTGKYGIIDSWGQLTVNDSMFTKNSGLNGGALYNESANGATINNTHFISNTATNMGGAILNEGAKLDVTDSTFDGNKAKVAGAIMDILKTYGEGISVKNSIIKNSEAEDVGGVKLLNANSIAQFDNVQFISNKATSTSDESESEGSGAVFIGSSAGANIINSTFDGNTSASHAGAIGTRVFLLGDNHASKMDISDSTFKNNTAATAGGAIDNYLYNSTGHNDAVYVKKTNFQTNSAANGGAVYNHIGKDGDTPYADAQQVAKIYFEDTNFTNNTASALGGAIYNEGIASVVANAADVAFSGNTANGEANDIYNIGTLNLTAAAEKSISLAGGIDGSAASIATNIINITNGGGYVQIANALKNQTVNNSGDLRLDGADLTGTTISGEGTVKFIGDASMEGDNEINSNVEVETGEELEVKNATITTTASGKLTNKAGGTLKINNSVIGVAVDNFGTLISDPTTYSGVVTNAANAYASFDNDTFDGTAQLANSGTVDLKNGVTFDSGATITGAGITNLVSGTTHFNNTSNTNTIYLAKGAHFDGTINGGTLDTRNGYIDSGLGSYTGSNLFIDADLTAGTMDAVSGTIKKVTLVNASYGTAESVTLNKGSSTFDDNVAVEGLNYYTKVEKDSSGNLLFSDKLLNTSSMRGTGDGSSTFTGDVVVGDKAASTTIGTPASKIALNQSAGTVKATATDGFVISDGGATEKTVTLSVSDTNTISTNNANITAGTGSVTAGSLVLNSKTISDIDTASGGTLKLDSGTLKVNTQATLASAASGQVADALAVKTALDDKANTSLNNITTAGETVIKDLADGQIDAAKASSLSSTSSTKLATEGQVVMALGNKIDTSAIATSLTPTSTNAQVASARAVYTALEGKVNTSDIVTSTAGWSSTTSDTKVASEKLVKNSLDAKVDTTRTINTKALSTDVVLNGADIALTGYTGTETGTVAAGDTINGAMAKLQNQVTNKVGTSDIITSTAGWSSTTSDTKVASEKLVKNSLDAKLDTTIANDTTVTVASGKQLTFGGAGKVKFLNNVVLSDASELSGIGAAKVTADNANLAVSNTALRATLADYATTADATFTGTTEVANLKFAGANTATSITNGTSESTTGLSLATTGYVTDAVTNKANTSLNNLTAAGTAVIDGRITNATSTNATVTNGDTKLVTGDQVYDSIQNFADKDLTTISTSGQNVIKSLADGQIGNATSTNTTVTNGDTKLVTGDQVYDSIQNFADKDLTTISTSGQNVIKSLADGQISAAKYSGTISDTTDATTLATAAQVAAYGATKQAALTSNGNPIATAVDYNYTTSSNKDKTLATVATVDTAITGERDATATLTHKTIDATANTISNLKATNFAAANIAKGGSETVGTTTKLTTETYVGEAITNATTFTNKNRVLISNASTGVMEESSVTGTELAFLSGTTSAVLEANDIVTSWSTTTSDTKVASEKLVKDSLDLKLTGTKEATYNASASGNTYYTAETVNSSFAKLNGDPLVNFRAATLAATTVNATTVNAGTNGTALTDGTLRLKNASSYDTTLSAISDGASGSLLNISTGAKVNGGLEATGNVKAAGLTFGSKTATSISTDITGATNNNVLATEAYADTKIAKTDIVKSTAGWSATPSDDKVTSEKLVYESLHGTGNATTPAGAVVIGDKAATTTLGTAKAQVALNDSAQTATITAANGIILSGPTTVTSIKFSGDAATDPAIVGVSQTVAGATANKLVTEGAVFAKTGTVTFSGMNYVGSATDLTTAVSNLDTNVYQDIHGTGTASAPAGAVAIGDKAATTTLGTTKAKIALNDSAQTATITAANGISLDGTKFVKSIDTATDTTTPANNDILATKSTVTNAIKGIFSGNNVWTGTNEFQNVLSVTRGGTKVFEVDALGKTTIASLSIGTSTPMNGIDPTPMKGNTTHLVTSAGVYEALHGTTSTGDTLMFGDEADGVIFGSTTGYNMTLDFGGSKTTIGNANGSVQMAEGALTASASVKAGTGSATSTMTSSSVKVADSGTYGEMTKDSITLHNSTGDVFSVTSDGSLTAGSTAASPTAKLNVDVANSTASISTQKGGTSSADLTINGATGKSELTSTKAATTATVSADASTGVASVTAADTTSKKSAGMTASAAAATAELSAANTATDSEASLALNGAAGTATLTADNGTNAMTATLSGKTFTVADNTTGTPSTILEAGVDASSNQYVTVNGDLTTNGKATFNGSTAGQKVEIENGVVTASNGFAVNNGTSDVFTVNAAGKTTTTTLAFTGDSGTNTVKAIDNGTTAQSIASTGISADQQQTMATVGTVLMSAQNATYTNSNGINTVLDPTDDNTINKAINKIDYVLSDVSNSLGDYSDLANQAATAGSNITVESPAPAAPEKTPTLVSAAIDLDNAIGNRNLYTGTHYANTAAPVTPPAPISVSEAIANMDGAVYKDIHGQGDSTTPLKGTVNIGDKAAVTQVGAQTSGKLTEGLAIDTANGKGVALGSFDTAGDPDTGLVVKKSSAGAYDTVELRAHSGSDEMTATLEKDSFKVKTGSTPTTILEVTADSTNGNHVDITGDENVTGNITVQDTITPSTAKVEIKNDGTVKTTDATGAQTVELKNNLMEAKDASNTSTYGAAGIVMNGTQFRVDATNGDMHAANGKFAVTTTSGKTTMSLTGDAVVTGNTKTGTFTMANANVAGANVTVTGIDKGGKPTVFSQQALATTASIQTKAENANFTGGQSVAGTYTYATADYTTGTQATTIKKAFQNVENFVGAKENMSHNAIKATTTPASVTAAVNTLATNVAAGMGGTFATDGSWSATIATTDKSVSYGNIAASSTPTANGLTGAIAQVHSNIGAGDVLNTIAARSSAIANNGVASTKTVNANIAALNDTIGDLTGLNKTNGNLTNGVDPSAAGYKDPTTVVEAFNNIDATLGRIHGLVQDNGNGTYTYNKSSGAVTQDWTNLAVGTTVEEHVLAVDTAIGNRNQYSHEYNIAKGDAIADSLEKIDVRMGDVASLNQMNYYREQNPNDVNLSSAVRALDTNLYRLEHDFKTLRHETHAGLASAAALSALVPNPRSAGDTTLSFGTGAYQGHTAAAFGGFHWITNNLMVNAGVGWDNREATARMGVSYSF